jgi:hypothetical protein
VVVATPYAATGRWERPNQRRAIAA